MNWSGAYCALRLLLWSSGKLTHIRDYTWFGYIIGIDAMSALAVGRLLACDYSCYISVSLLRKSHWFYMFRHVVLSHTLPSRSRCCCSLVDMWETRECNMHGTHRGHLQPAPDVSC